MNFRKYAFAFFSLMMQAVGKHRIKIFKSVDFYWYWTRYGLEVSYGVNELGYHWFRWWLDALSAPSNYLKRSWCMEMRPLVTILIEIPIEMLIFSVNEMYLEVSFEICRFLQATLLIRFSVPCFHVLKYCCRSYEMSVHVILAFLPWMAPLSYIDLIPQNTPDI